MTDGRLRNTILPSMAALVLAAMAFGATFVVVKDALAAIPPLALVAWRFAIGSIALISLSFPTRTALWRDGAIAGVWLFAGYAFQTAGLQTTGATNSALITGLYVVFTPIVVAIWNRRPPLAWVVVGTVMAFMGLILLTVQDGFSFGSGDLLTLVCAIGFAGHIAYLSRRARFHPVVQFTAVQLLTTSALAFVASFVFEGPQLPPIDVVPTLLGLGLGVSAVAYLLQVWAQTRIGPSRTAVVLSLEPVFGVIFGALLLGERLDLRGWIGAAVILAAIQVVLANEPEHEVLAAEGVAAVG